MLSKEHRLRFVSLMFLTVLSSVLCMCGVIPFGVQLLISSWVIFNFFIFGTTIGDKISELLEVLEHTSR